MDRYRRNLTLDVFDYANHRLCGLYDNSLNVSGQAANIFVTTERNGWKELSFTLPSVCEGRDGPEENFRLKYLKADYRIRQIDDDGIDWFIVSEPKITHHAFSKNVSVNAGHIAQLLKTKNLGLEFSDEEGNNVGTAEQLLTTILDGTGWKVGNVDTFYEKDEKTVKQRSLQKPAKTGAFKLITEMCGLFDAKPIFHGHTKTVDIIPMNPFSEPKDGELPDITKADGVLELHYGQGVKGITRTLNTDNIVTKLYAYGSYGDKTSGYCGIDECTHKEYVYTQTSDLSAGTSYMFSPEGFPSISFIPSADVPAGNKIIWSAFDVMSMSYVWDDYNQLAYPAGKDALTCLVDNEGSVLKDSASIVVGSGANSFTELDADLDVVDQQNWFSFLMDFSYYQNTGLLTQEMMNALAVYQRKGAELYKETNTAMQSYLDIYTQQTEVIGDINFCKLNISSIQSHDGYAQLILTNSPVSYRTDYAVKERNYFPWTPAETIDDKGDPVNNVASVMYIVHDTVPVSWEKVYIKALNQTIYEAQKGEDLAAITSITLWTPYSDISLSPSDHFYLFERNEVNALQGSWEAADEAKVRALTSATKVVTSNHPVYFTENALPAIDVNKTNGYAWAWKYDPSGATESQLYFHYGDGTNAYYASNWAPVFFTNHVPQGVAQPAYWYNWADLVSWDSSTLYCLTSSGWVKATSSVIGGIGSTAGTGGLKQIPFDIEDTWKLFGTVYNACKERDRLYQGYRQYATYTVTNLTLTAGNYYIEDDYGDYYVFSTKEDLSSGSTLTHDRFSGWIEQTTSAGIKTILEIKKYPFDGVTYNNDVSGMIIINKEHYTLLSNLAVSGLKRGIIHFIEQFRDLADEAFGIRLNTYLESQEEIRVLEDSLIETLGDLYREGWWQSEDYVDGDEIKLYEDALENLRKISQPEASYNVDFLDRYGANDTDNYGVSDVTSSIPYPDISIMSAAHLVDPEIDLNLWAYLDKIKKCYDQPWQTAITINTNLTVMAQHSFTDVLTNIANVTNELKNKMSVYKRAEALTTDGQLAAERLEGAIDAAKQKIFGGNSTWYTDEAGNMIFESADGSSAMTLTGNGFAIASSKNEWGEWNWRTFGTGQGFTADEITTGFLSADRIQANSISSYKLDYDTQNLLGWVKGSELRLSPDSIKATVTGTIMDEMNLVESELKQSIISQTAGAVRIEFQEEFDEIESLTETQDNLNAWFNFSEDGLQIGAASADGTESPFYTKQNNIEYGFYKDNTKLAAINGEGMDIPQVRVDTQLRIGNLILIVGEDDAINWVYDPA